MIKGTHTHTKPFPWNFEYLHTFFCYPFKCSDSLATLSPAWQITGHSWLAETSGRGLPDDLASAQWQTRRKVPTTCCSLREKLKPHGRSPFIWHIWATREPTRRFLFCFSSAKLSSSRLCDSYFLHQQSIMTGVGDRQSYTSFLMAHWAKGQELHLTVNFRCDPIQNTYLSRVCSSNMTDGLTDSPYNVTKAKMFIAEM